MSFIYRFDVFSFFVIFLSITLDFEISFLSVSYEKTIQKISNVEIVIETKFAFVAIVFDFLIISSNEISISDRNAKKESQNEQNFSTKKNSNNVEQQSFNAFSSLLSFNVSKSKD